MNKKTNKIKPDIGRYVTAFPKEGADWVTYSSNDEDEKDYYRDVYHPITGILIYCYGETCQVKDYNPETQTVTLLNENIENQIFGGLFTIPLDQFIVDFV